MLYKWKCPKCGKTVTKYQTICDSMSCSGVRSLFSWLVNWDNLSFWISIGLTIFMFIVLFLIFS